TIMKVTLRKRTKNQKISLYLDIYAKGERRLEYLRLYLVEKPKTPQDRKTNNDTLELAENIRAKRQLEYQNNRFGFHNKSKENGKFLVYFELQKEKKIASQNNYGNWESAYKHLLKWDKSDVRLVDIDINWLESLKIYLIHDALTRGKRNLSKNTCVSYFNKVLATLKHAEKEGILRSNPGKLVDGIKEAETQREFLTLEELKKAISSDCSIDVLKRAFIFSALTGLRFSDVQKLIWTEIQHSEENGYYIRFEQKKTRGKETLPISEDAYGFLGNCSDQNSPVFLGLEYSDHNNIKLREWMIRAGIDKHITFHSARHTYATLQLTFGTDLYTVSKLLGHKSIKTTQVYAKIVDQKKIEAANRIKLD
ncbi:MAG: site-specific integrase, partial [Prolixibacteraceae bacterium]|nr:site-specific integrase [Prolixibacteraceae bacterium]